MPPAIKNLIIINVLMWLATWAISSYYGIDLDNYLGLFYFQSPKFHIYQYITYMFMHGGFFHILMNMYALFLFGSALEQVWGSKRFLIFYFVTGVGAALFYTFVNYLEFKPMITAAHAFINTPSPELLQGFIKHYVTSPNREVYDFINQWSQAPKDPQFINSAIDMVNNHIQEMYNIPTIGASGAVFGVLLGFGMLFPNTQLMLLIPPIPIKAKYVVLIYGGIELYFSISQPGDAVAHVAHIGGMIFGFIMIKMWQKDRRHFY